MGQTEAQEQDCKERADGGDSGRQLRLAARRADQRQAESDKGRGDERIGGQVDAHQGGRPLQRIAKGEKSRAGVEGEVAHAEADGNLGARKLLAMLRL